MKPKFRGMVITRSCAEHSVDLESKGLLYTTSRTLCDSESSVR
jgi:hypothetical protein